VQQLLVALLLRVLVVRSVFLAVQSLSQVAKVPWGRVALYRLDLLMAVLPAPVVPCLCALVHLRPDPVALWRWAVARRLAVRPALCL